MSIPVRPLPERGAVLRMRQDAGTRLGMAIHIIAPWRAYRVSGMRLSVRQGLSARSTSFNPPPAFRPTDRTASPNYKMTRATQIPKTGKMTRDDTYTLMSVIIHIYAFSRSLYGYNRGGVTTCHKWPIFVCFESPGIFRPPAEKMAVLL